MGPEIEKSERSNISLREPKQKKTQVKIISDGTPSGTKVMIGDVQIPLVTKIEIDPLTCTSEVTAKITLCDVALEYEVHDSNINEEQKEILLQIATSRLKDEDKEI